MGSLFGTCDPKANPVVRGTGESVQEICSTISILTVSLLGAFSACAESSF